jgi:hypothetical protein
MNEYAPLMLAVVTQGPIAISVDAGWGAYEEGVFAAADGGTDIDHAVVLVGYGTDADSGLDYWLVRNSWGERRATPLLRFWWRLRIVVGRIETAETVVLFSSFLRGETSSPPVVVK